MRGRNPGFLPLGRWFLSARGVGKKRVTRYTDKVNGIGTGLPHDPAMARPVITTIRSVVIGAGDTPSPRSDAGTSVRKDHT